MIKLLELEMRNFLSHSDSILGLCEYDGLILIEGKNASGLYSSNGSGKSTILEGIIYALTGNTLRGLGVNDVINRNKKKNTRVALTFQIDDIDYNVIRYRKHDEFGDSLFFYKDGENISKRLNKDTQALIDSTLGISYKVLISTMLLGEGLSSRFTQLSDPDKKSLIESTLNLSYDFSLLRTRAHSELAKLKLEKATLEGKLSTLKELSDFNVEDAIESIKRYDDEVSKSKVDLTNLQEYQNDLKSKIDLLDKKISLLNSTILQIDNLSSTISRQNLTLYSYREELNTELSRESPLCPVCHQSLLSEESKSAFISNYENKITLLSREIEGLESQLAELPEKSILESKLGSVTLEKESLRSEMDNYTYAVSKLSGSLWEAQSKADQLRREVQEYKESTQDIQELESKSSELCDSVTKYDYFYNLFAPTGIIVSILSDAVEYINGRLSTYSEVLLEKDYKISFVKGKISLQDSKGSNYQSLSNGEKRRLDIAIQFSLHDYVNTYCGLKLDTLFIDEILDTVDDIGTQNIFEVLRMKLDYCNLKSIFVITHNDSLKSFFDNLVAVEKDLDGNSRIKSA